MANNETNDLRLAQVFATKVFRIPDYQRGYAWGVRQWNDPSWWIWLHWSIQAIRLAYL